MNKIKPFLHKGTRDFLPDEVAQRNYIFETIKTIFHRYGFVAIETPAIERLEILTGKYGEEGDQLLFKILNSGDYLQKVVWNTLKTEDENGETISYKKLTPKISEKGLRYDLTVPLARYVVMHQEELIFPFRRYHIGPVWRADRPGKGRFQEFYQCDADIIGTTSLLCELDLTQMILDVFKSLNMKVKIKLNHRKIIESIADNLGIKAQMNKVLIIIDKFDKIGMQGVRETLEKEAILSTAKLNKLMKVLSIKSLNELKKILGPDEIGKKGIEDLEFLMKNIPSDSIEFDITLARGLDYYTGCIFEVVSTDHPIGSILGGGRYHNLTEVFGGKDMSGVGISFGIERIFEIMSACNLFPTLNANHTKVLIINSDDKDFEKSLELLKELRQQGIPSEYYPTNAKLEKQMKYANAKKIAYVVFMSGENLGVNEIILKNMETGVQENINKSLLKEKIK